MTVNWKKESSVCVVMAAAGYPGTYKKGEIISGLNNANSIPGVVLFHAGTKEHNGKVITNGGRVLGVTAMGENKECAIERAYDAVGKVNWKGIHYRKDIGSRGMN